MVGELIVLTFLLLMAYLLGSIPSSVWIGKSFYGIDLRDHGSGNAGATNAFRVLGKKTAFLVLLIDVLKGMAAVGLSFLVSGIIVHPEWFKVYQYGLGLCALLGHVFPLFAGFRGGKGIATLTGIIVVLFPAAFLVCFVAFLLVFLLTRYVSLGSILAAVTFGVFVIFFSDGALLSEILFSIIVAVFVPFTHLKNIKRLVKGTENKITFSPKKPAP